MQWRLHFAWKQTGTKTKHALKMHLKDFWANSVAICLLHALLMVTDKEPDIFKRIYIRSLHLTSQIFLNNFPHLFW